MNTKYVLIGVGILILGGVAYYGISPLFDTKRVNDPAPARTAAPATTSDESTADTAATSTPAETDSERAANERPSAAIVSGTVIGTGGHPASGTAKVLSTDDGRILRYENFSTINGPRLHVYLAKTKDADDFIDLGPIKGTEGNINYEIPDDVDISEYSYALTWCVPFGVLFNYTQLQ